MVSLILLNKKYNKLNKIASIVCWTFLYCSSEGNFFFLPIPGVDKVEEEIINNKINNLNSINNSLNSTSLPPILKINVKK